MNTHLQFQWEFGLYEIRTVHQDFKDRNSPIRKNNPIELIKYENENKQGGYLIAYFALDEDGYELHSCHGRLFEEVSPSEIKEIWPQLKAGQEMLDAYFKACEVNG